MREDIKMTTKSAGTPKLEAAREDRRAGRPRAHDWQERLAIRGEERSKEQAFGELEAKARQAVKESIRDMFKEHRNCGEPLWVLPPPSKAKATGWDPFCASAQTRGEKDCDFLMENDPREIDEYESKSYEGERRDNNMSGLLAVDKRPDVEALRGLIVEAALEEMPPHAARAFRLYARSRSVYGLAVSLAMTLQQAIDVLDWAIHCIDGAFVRAGLEPVSEVTKAVVL